MAGIMSYYTTPGSPSPLPSPFPLLHEKVEIALLSSLIFLWIVFVIGYFSYACFSLLRHESETRPQSPRRLIRIIRRRDHHHHDHDHDHDHQHDLDDSNNIDIASVACTYTSLLTILAIHKSSSSSSGDRQPAAVISGRDSCSICLEDLKLGEECRVFVKCGHVHHKACVDSWLSRDTHCPLCRASVRGASLKLSRDHDDDIV